MPSKHSISYIPWTVGSFLTLAALAAVGRSRCGAPRFTLQKSGFGDSDGCDNNHISTCV